MDGACGESELLRIGGLTGTATLLVMCGALHEPTLTVIASGDLVLATVMRLETRFAVVVCSVEGHQWLLAQDAPVIRVGPRMFAFAFHHYICALSLPDGCFDQQVNRLELALQSFSSYRNYSGRREFSFPPRSPPAAFWASSYATILSLCAEMVPQPVPNPNVNAAQAIFRRSITATDLILQALELIDSPHQQITIAGPIPSSASRFVFPSICIITDVVEAIRTAAAGGVALWAPSRWQHLARARTDCWHFNTAGLARILQLV